MADGGIAWTDETLNPIRARHRVTGKVGWYCQRVSDGCKHCYAATMNEWRGTGVDYTVTALDDVELFLDEVVLTAPLRWHRPRRVFLCSMTDLFADFVPEEWIDHVFARMVLTNGRHVFQLLTKRPERMREYLTAGATGPRILSLALLCSQGGRRDFFSWPLPNAWLGVSIEDQATADERIPLLLQTPAALRWVSYEPALAEVNFAKVPERPLAFAGTECAPSLDWLVVGGESGPGARPFDLAWARSAIAQCRAAGVPVFCKQIGSFPIWDGCGLVANNPPSETFKDDVDGREVQRLKLRDRKGGAMEEWPEDLRVREWPT